MLSLPDGWEFSEEGLSQLSNDSRTSIRSTLKELMEYGYLTRNRIRDEKGKLRDTEYVIYEEPMYQKPTLEKPTLEKPMLENVHNKILNNKELNNKELNNKYTTTPTIYDFLQENGFNLTPISYEVVSQWEDNELTRYAIKQAVLNNKYNINYINKILYSYEKDNIQTVQQAIEREEDFNSKRDSYYKNKYEHKQRGKSEREKRIEEWLLRDD